MWLKNIIIEKINYSEEFLPVGGSKKKFSSTLTGFLQELKRNFFIAYKLSFLFNFK
jgi:hypothetical protein